MTKKTVKEGLVGKPIIITFIFDEQEVEMQLFCPLCGCPNFVFDHTLTVGGCTNTECPCVCFERVKDQVDLGGVQWMI